MEKIFDFLHLRKPGRIIGIVFIALALAFEIAEFILEIFEHGFYFENLFVLTFEVLTCSFIIYSLIKKNIKLLEVAIVILKTFEGTYYPLRSAQRLDAMLHNPTTTSFEVTNHIFFAISAFFMVFALVVYSVHKLNGRMVFWNIMKMLILVASILMLTSTILYIIEFRHSNVWFEVFEPVSLTCMFFGVYGTCEYIEGELHREKKANIA